MTDNAKLSLEYEKNSQGIMEFIDLHWKKDHILSLNNVLFDWQYKDKNKYNFIVARDEKKIIGILGFIPNTKYDSEIQKKIIWLALWKVSDKKEYLGIGTRLLLKLINENPESVIAVNGIEENVLKIYKSLGFRISYLKQFYILNLKIKSQLVSKLHKLNLNRNNNLSQNTEGSFEEVNDKLLDLNEDFFLKFNKYKSKNFLIERYVKHPFYEYSIYLYKSIEGYDSLIVMREISIKDEKISRIVDFIGDIKSIKFLSRFLFRLAIDKKYSYIDFLVDGIDEQILLEAGFHLSNIEGTYLPNYFEPLLMDFVTINTAIRLNENMTMPIFKGDGDQDRPNSKK